MARALAIIGLAGLLWALAGCDRPEVVEVQKALPAMQERASQVVSGEPLFAFPDGPSYSEEGWQLILDFEVGGGRAYYEKQLARISWPGYQSGATGGIGYDFGQTSPGQIRKDWGPYLSASQVERLALASGKTGQAGKAAALGLRDIVIPWDAATAVYRSSTIPRFWQLTNRAWPGASDLLPDGQWPLLSLVFNRGSSLKGDRRREMAAIKPLVPREDYPGMARQTRLMKRLWRGSDIERGMNRRRDAEAQLLESCGGKPLSSWIQYRPEEKLWSVYAVLTASANEGAGGWYGYDLTFEIRGNFVF